MLALTLLLFSLISSPTGRATATTIPPTPFEGRVAQVVYGASGNAEGLVLDDHTLLEFPAGSLQSPSPVTTGDRVSGTGALVLSAPNRVFDRVALSRGTERLFDNSGMKYAPAPPLVPSGSTAGSTKGGVPAPELKYMTETSPLIAVGSNPDGQIDRLILAYGSSSSYVQIPLGAYVNPKSVNLGQPVAVQGAGIQFANGALFVHALTAQTVGGPWLLQARGYDGERWMLKEGSIKQALVTPQGFVDGVLLTDNTSVFFTPVPGGQVPELLPGVRIRAAGPGVANRMNVDSLILSRRNEFIPLAPVAATPGTLAQVTGQMAGQAPASQLIPMKDSARVEAVFRNDRGEIDTIVLSDRTRVYVPSRLRTLLPRGIRPGKQLAVTGRGGDYAMGTSIEADRINLRRG